MCEYASTHACECLCVPVSAWVYVHPHVCPSVCVIIAAMCVCTFCICVCLHAYYTMHAGTCILRFLPIINFLITQSISKFQTLLDSTCACISIDAFYKCWCLTSQKLTLCPIYKVLWMPLTSRMLVYTMTREYQLTSLAQVCILHTTNNYVVKTMLLHKQMKLLLLLLASEY